MPIRLLLLKVFGVLCGLDSTVIGVLLTSVLPNELGRDIQQGLNDIQKTLYSSTVCTMVFSTAEAVPLPVYGENGCACVHSCCKNQLACMCTCMYIHVPVYDPK